MKDAEVEAVARADDGIACPVCRGSGQVVGEHDRVVCQRCWGDGAWHLAALDDARKEAK